MVSQTAEAAAINTTAAKNAVFVILFNMALVPFRIEFGLTWVAQAARASSAALSARAWQATQLTAQGMAWSRLGEISSSRSAESTAASKSSAVRSTSIWWRPARERESSRARAANRESRAVKFLVVMR